jgi:PmbA protein
MHPTLQRAEKLADQAELYWSHEHTISVRYENYTLQQVIENDRSESSLRVIQDGKIGAAYAVSPDRSEFLDHAILAARYGDPARFSFAGPAVYPDVDHADPQTGKLTSADLIETCEQIKARIRPHLPDVALAVGAHCSDSTLSIQTTRGADASDRATAFSYYFGAPFAGAGIGIYRFAASTSPRPVDDALIDEFIEWYTWGRNTSTPSTGRLPVLLAPQAAFLLLMPLLAGVSADAVWKGTSPLKERMGETILSEKLTVRDNPLLDGNVHARRFDDEGVPCAERIIVKNGKLQQFLFDQRLGAAMDQTSTGHGFKRALFGSGNETPVTPWFACPIVDAGDDAWRDLVRGMSEGLLITGGMGFHSGNYAQGQFSVQAVGFHILEGKVVGRLDKTMISGNIYEDGHRIAALSRETAPPDGFLSMGQSPYILFDSLGVAGRSS